MHAWKLWVYNFGVHDCVDNTDIMNMWDESTAKRGSCEVVSCLQSLPEDRQTGAQRLIFFSDECCGPNKNQVMVAFLLRLIERGVYKSIYYKFLVWGHTFLPNDRDFSCIEAKKSRNGLCAIWLGEDCSRSKGEESIYSQSLLTRHFHEPQAVIILHQNTFHRPNWSNPIFQGCCYGESEEYSCESGCLEKVAHKCMKRGRCTFQDPTQLYTSPVPIKAVKYNGLVRLCEKHLRPEYRNFYINKRKWESKEMEMRMTLFYDWDNYSILISWTKLVIPIK